MHTQDGNNLVSHIGGVRKTFPFDPRQPGSKQAAEKARSESDTQIQRAIQSRAQQLFGRNAKEHEMKFGLKLPDTRPLRERIREDVQSLNVNGNLVADGAFLKRDPKYNVWPAYIADLEAALAKTPATRTAEIAQLKRRLEQAKTKSEATERRIEALWLKEKGLSLIIDRVTLADQWLGILLNSPSEIDQKYIELCMTARDQLQTDKDTAAFDVAMDVWQKQREAEYAGRQSQLESQVKELQQRVKAVNEIRKADAAAEKETVEQYYQRLQDAQQAGEAEQAPPEQFQTDQA